MSYCRFGDSDAYMISTGIRDGRAGWVCYGCELTPNKETFETEFIGVILAHMKAHKEAGHRVDRAISRLELEIKAKKLTED